MERRVRKDSIIVSGLLPIWSFSEADKSVSLMLSLPCIMTEGLLVLKGHLTRESTRQEYHLCTSYHGTAYDILKERMLPLLPLCFGQYSALMI